MKFRSISMQAAFPLALLAFLPAQAQNGKRFELVRTDSGVTVHVDGKLFADYIVDQGNKPFLYPIIGPAGDLMTRGYPMIDVEGERQDHPHHRSLWFGHEDVNGFDTWHEPLSMEERAARKKDPAEREAYLKEALSGLASTVHREFARLSADKNRAILVSRNDYVDPSGNKLMADERTFTFRALKDGTRMIDVDIVLSAPYGPVVLGDAKDAGFSVRVPTVLDVDSNLGGVLINSKGDRGKKAWGKRADWCDYHGMMDGRRMGIAILNHPESFRYPTPWHVRTYGLMTANPFGLQAVAKEKDSGKIELRGSETITLRHRVVLHEGDHEAAGIQTRWEAYAKGKW